MRSALIASAVSILLSTVMLAGATFAWFTDSVTSSGNTIQAGTLNTMATAAPVDTAKDTSTIPGDGTTPPLNGGKPFGFGSAVDIEQTGPIIGEANWEPGRTNAKLLTVTNTGTLAARIKLDFDLELAPELENALWFDFIRIGPNNEIAGTYERREISTLKAVADATELTLGPANADGSAPADPAQPNSVSFILVYGMAEEAGNNVQGKEFRAAVHVLATQAPKEQDGFGSNQYDKDAVYPVASSQELADKIANAQPGETVLVAAGSFELPAEVKEGVIIQGSGADTNLTVPVTPSGNKATGLVVNEPNVSIRNVTLVGSKNIASDEYYGVIDIRNGGTILDGVTFSNIPGSACAVVIKNGVDDGESVTISNTVIPASLGLFKAINIVDGVNGTINIVNSDITAIYPFNVNSSSSQNLVINVTGSKLHGWTSYGNIKSASFTDTDFSKGNSSYNFMRPHADTTLTNCTFDATFKLGAGAVGKTITIENCTYNGTKLTAKNVQELLLDMEDVDGKNLRACTILVDGEKATLTE